MARKYADLVRQYSSTTGTGPFTLTTVPLGFRSFASKLVATDTFYYSAQNLDKPAEVEVGIGTFQSDGTITRAAVGGATNFTVGKKSISLVVGSAFFAAVQALLDSGVASGADLAALNAAIGLKADSSAVATALAAKADTAAVNTALAAKADAAATTTALGLKADVSALSAKVDVSALSELIDDRVAILLAGGTNVTLTYDDALNRLTISSTGGGGGGGAPTGAMHYNFATQSGLLALLED